MEKRIYHLKKGMHGHHSKKQCEKIIDNANKKLFGHKITV